MKWEQNYVMERVFVGVIFIILPCLKNHINYFEQKETKKVWHIFEYFKNSLISVCYSFGYASSNDFELITKHFTRKFMDSFRSSKPSVKQVLHKYRPIAV